MIFKQIAFYSSITSANKGWVEERVLVCADSHKHYFDVCYKRMFDIGFAHVLAPVILIFKILNTSLVMWGRHETHNDLMHGIRYITKLRWEVKIVNCTPFKYRLSRKILNAFHFAISWLIIHRGI